MIRRTDFMIVSGNGRDTGKTSFICAVISIVSRDYPLTAIKVSPHFHGLTVRDEALITTKDFVIFRENDPDGEKDSSRMLRAGAERVFYIEAKDDHISSALKALLEIHQTDGPVICESGGMRHFIEPSVFVLLNRKGKHEFKPGFEKLSPLADRLVTFDGTGFDLLPENIRFKGKRWLFYG